jgi:hypothetical protein
MLWFIWIQRTTLGEQCHLFIAFTVFETSVRKLYYSIAPVELMPWVDADPDHDRRVKDHSCTVDWKLPGARLEQYNPNNHSFHKNTLAWQCPCSKCPSNVKWIVGLLNSYEHASMAICPCSKCPSNMNRSGFDFGLLDGWIHTNTLVWQYVHALNAPVIWIEVVRRDKRPTSSEA